MFNAHIQDDLPLIAGGLASPDGYIMAGGSGNFVINEVPELKWSGGIAQQPVIRYFGPSGETNKACASGRSEEHTSELQSLMRISYAVFCLKKKHNINNQEYTDS